MNCIARSFSHITAACVLVLSPLASQAPSRSAVPLPTAAMDNYLTRLSRFGASGAALVMRNGQVVYQKGFGWADRTRRIPMSAETGVDIASMSKDLTAIAILQLEERGLLKRSDSLAKYFDAVPADKRAITIEQLLKHRSGLPSYFVEGNDFTLLTRQQALDSIFNKKLEFAPGTEEGYSDAGYVLLAILLERRTGTTLEAFLAQEQFRPAGLSRTFSYGTAALRSAKGIAHGYTDTTDAGSAASYVPGPNYWVVKGAGGIISTVTDIAKWEAALRSGKFIGSRSLATLLGRDASDTTGLAGPPQPLPSGKRGWIRTGSQDFGFSAGAIRYVDDSTIAVIALNRQPEEMDIAFLRTRLLMALDGFISGAIPTTPPDGRPIPVTVARMVGTYTLPDGSSIRVTRDAESLVIIPNGPLAVELLSYSTDTVGRAERLALASQATNILAKLCQGDLAPLRQALARPSERIEGFLKSTACGDPATRVRVIGSVPHWWGRTTSSAPATLLEITTPTKTTRIRFEWEGGHINAVGGGGIVAPVVRFVATRVPTEFVGYHLGIGAPVTALWNARLSEQDQIVFPSAGNQKFVASRVPPSPR